MTGRRLFWILLPLLVLALIYQVRRTGELWRSSRYLAVVEARTVQAGLRGRMSFALAESNLELMRLAAEVDPVEVLVPIYRGNQYLLTDRPQAAERAYREALELEPRGEVYANLGKAELAMGNEEAARQSFRTALKLDHTQLRDLRRHLPELRKRKRRAPRAREEGRP